jgi:hypothetical protein
MSRNLTWAGRASGVTAAGRGARSIWGGNIGQLGVWWYHTITARGESLPPNDCCGRVRHRITLLKVGDFLQRGPKVTFWWYARSFRAPFTIRFERMTHASSAEFRAWHSRNIRETCVRSAHPPSSWTSVSCANHTPSPVPAASTRVLRHSVKLESGEVCADS